MSFGVWRLTFRLRKLNYRFFAAGLLCLALAALPSCSGGDRFSSWFGSGEPTTSRPMKAGKDLAAPPEKAPPDIATVPPFEAEPGGMLGAFGVNLDTYFAEDIQDPIERIKRLEHIVSAMQRDLRTVAPPMQELVAVEAEMQELVGQLETLIENEPVPLDAKTAPQPLAPAVGGKKEAMPAPAPAAAAAPTPVPQHGGGIAVSGIRTGQHADKTRLVLDISGDTAYTADLDNNENILIVELPGTGWNAVPEQNFRNVPVLKNYRVEPSNGGSMLIVQLTQPTAILYEKKLDALSGSGKRIVIDLRK